MTAVSEIYRILWYFAVYAVLGWCVEVVYCTVKIGKAVNRGFLNGPVCPVYGFGMLAICRAVDLLPVESMGEIQFVPLFLTGMVLASLVELIAGWGLFHLFQARWWDYSDYKLNFRGYICLRFFIYWGIAASLGIYVLHPIVKHLISLIHYPVRIGVLVFFTVILVTDIVTTIITIVGFKKKFEAMEKVVSGTKIVSDLIGSQIYGAVDTIVTVSEPTRNHYEQYRKLLADNRQQERELAAQHRAEEKAFANQFTEAEKASLRLAKEQASNAMVSFVRSFKKNEQRLVKVVMVRSGDAGAAVMRFIKGRTETGSDEIFNIGDDPSDSPDI